MLEFQTRAERGERSYREVVADGQAELATLIERCPNCRGPIAAPVPVIPVGLPDRDPLQRAARQQALQPTAAKLAAEARKGLPEHTFAIWIAPLVVTDATTDALFVAAPPSLASWVSERYGPLLARLATRFAGRAMRVEIYPDTLNAPALGALIDASEEAA